MTFASGVLVASGSLVMIHPVVWAQKIETPGGGSRSLFRRRHACGAAEPFGAAAQLWPVGQTPFLKDIRGMKHVAA